MSRDIFMKRLRLHLLFDEVAMVTHIVGDVLSSVLLCAVVLLVLVGNTLVVAAVATSRKLRTVTNVFIVNLACADLLLGVLVLPFSAVNEIKDVWIFGHVWCQVWLAVDVWLCTASILNLCCISLDRYLAITRPIRYPGLMSAKRAKTLVAGVWLFSFVICCPPLIGWNDGGDGIMDYNGTTATPIPVTTTQTPVTGRDDVLCDNGFNYSTNSNMNTTCTYSGDSSLSTTCELTNSRGYRIYAALGSFFIPMLVMVFFYLQIYRAAVKTISAYAKGELKTKYSVRENGSKTNSVTLRIHRGGRGPSTGSSVYRHGSTYGGSAAGAATREGCGDKDAAGGRRFGRQEMDSHLPVRKCRSSDASLVTLTGLKCEIIDNGNAKHGPISELIKGRGKSFFWRKEKKRSVGGERESFENSTRNGRSTRAKLCGGRCLAIETDICSSGECSPRTKRIKEHARATQHNSLPVTPSLSSQNEETDAVFVRGTSNSEYKPRRSRLSAHKPGHAMRLHMQKFNREKKAAKTLAIIVGAFIMCWMPFFTIYLVGAFCENCISPIVFSVAFWLGYCNSAMNPCVYALFSRDFRFAFRKLLTCSCKAWSKNRSFRPQTSDVPAIQLHCATQDDAKSSSDIGADGQWR
ncbi:unnamed protein product [Lymnaea stagnalis]|uniref:G-protein coupled receptors family 1 profile domain-containing protein n=1 Tax=Lymnaea stagnalis TaxID=6523 RepID=A0AAV2HZV9_LYMST